MQEREQLYIDGQWTQPDGAGRVAVIDSATEEEMGFVPAGTERDVDHAVAAASAAFPAWAATPVKERADACREVARLLRAREEEMAMTISREVGTSLGMSYMAQSPVAALLLDLYADMATAYEWDTEVPGAIVAREPLGVVGAITPWNYPLTLAAYKVAPALVAGCTIVLKPSELAPLSLFALAEAVHAAGLPPGVFNLVTGEGPSAGAHLTAHPDVDMVSFTGSTATGARVAASGAATIKRVHLELGGKSANVVLDDADLAGAVTAGIDQVLMNSGQTCFAWTRILVPESQHEEACEVARAAVANYAPGNPTEGAALGPLVSAEQRDSVRAHIDRAVADGTRLIAGGSAAPVGLDRGFFVDATVFAGVRSDQAIAQEEVFGPVVAILPYRDEADAVRIANDSEYGLAGAVFSADTDRATAVARQMRTGTVDVNGFSYNPMAPFGGYRRSGVGRELGVAGLEAFLETKSINRPAGG